MSERTATSLEATKAEFEELLEKIDLCLTRGNALNRQVTQMAGELLRLGREIKAVMSKAREGHGGSAESFDAVVEMFSKFKAVMDRHPDHLKAGVLN